MTPETERRINLLCLWLHAKGFIQVIQEFPVDDTNESRTHCIHIDNVANETRALMRTPFGRQELFEAVRQLHMAIRADYPETAGFATTLQIRHCGGPLWLLEVTQGYTAYFGWYAHPRMWIRQLEVAA